MRELSLFSGAGGGLLASKLLGWEAVGYVEKDDYCQRVIAARIKDGILDRAPIFGDIRAFIDRGYADGYQGMVDVVSGGFPCQPFSAAGKQRGAEDFRNLWPETIEAIRRVRPKHVFLENVAALLANSHAGTIFGQLAECGYDAKWECISAQQLGAPHKRDRLWIVGTSGRIPYTERGAIWIEREREREQHRKPSASIVERDGEAQSLAGSDGARELCHAESGNEKRDRSLHGSEANRDRARGLMWWSAEPGLGRVADVVASRMDRLKAIGNGQVSIVAAAAWRALSVR